MLPSTEDDNTTDSSAELKANVRHTSLDRQRHHLKTDKQDKHQCCSEYKMQPVSSNSAQFTSEPNQILATFGKVVSFSYNLAHDWVLFQSAVMELWLWGIGNWAWGLNKGTLNVGVLTYQIIAAYTWLGSIRHVKCKVDVLMLTRYQVCVTATTTTTWHKVFTGNSVMDVQTAEVINILRLKLRCVVDCF